MKKTGDRRAGPGVKNFKIPYFWIPASFISQVRVWRRDYTLVMREKLLFREFLFPG
jgi:hypothetical protein